MKNRKPKGIETLKSRYGLIFISPWILGMAIFFVLPIFKSIFYCFASLEITADGVRTQFVGLANFREILLADPKYTDNLFSALSNLLLNIPFILVVSLVLALLLNSRFKGRLFFRSLFFTPVIITSGLVLSLFLNAAATDATQVAVSSEVSFTMIDFAEVLEGLRFPPAIEKYLTAALNNIFMLVWQSGIQIVLFIAGLQSIPELLYEVSKVEGATKWQEFWFITLPMLLRTMLLVIIFTVVELVTSNTNPAITQGYNSFNTLRYGIGSAMLWFYFLLAGIFVALILFVYNIAFLKKWG